MKTTSCRLDARRRAGAAFALARGQVLEGGMPRFFRRLAEGVFDEVDVRRRADDLAAFIAEARAAYGTAGTIALGFSNGANIAAAVMQLHPGVLAGGVLLRAMVPLKEAPVADLSGTRIHDGLRRHGPHRAEANARTLAATFSDMKADVRHEVLPVGHGLSQGRPHPGPALAGPVIAEKRAGACFA